MKLVTKFFIKNDNDQLTGIGEEEQPYVQGENLDVEFEVVHDPQDLSGHPLPRPKTAPKF